MAIKRMSVGMLPPRRLSAILGSIIQNGIRLQINKLCERRWVSVDKAKTTLVVLLFMSLLLQGCMLLALGAGAGAGAGTVAYIKGELRTTYASSMDRTWNATLRALRDLDIIIVSSRKDETKGEIQARQSDDTKVKIAMEPSGPNTTLVKIRVGMFGDDAASRAINSKIASRLGV
jgi:major membrane immunogen (membrane-anchored lipoprotein)